MSIKMRIVFFFLLTFNIQSEWVIECSLSRRCWWCPLTLLDFYSIVLHYVAYRYNNAQQYLLLHSDRVSQFRTNQSALYPECCVPQCTTLTTNTLTITHPMQFQILIILIILRQVSRFPNTQIMTSVWMEIPVLQISF